MSTIRTKIAQKKFPRKIFEKPIDKRKKPVIIKVQKENNFHEMLLSNKGVYSNAQVRLHAQVKFADRKVRHHRGIGKGIGIPKKIRSRRYFANMINLVSLKIES